MADDKDKGAGGTGGGDPPADDKSGADAVQAQLRLAQKEREKAEKRAQDAEAKAKALEDAAKTEDQKIRERAAEAEKWKAQAEKSTASIGRLLEIEMADVPEDKRERAQKLLEAVPDPEGRLVMLKELKTEGLFRSSDATGDTTRSPPPKTGTERPPPQGNSQIDWSRISDHAYFKAHEKEIKEELAKGRGRG